jgi:hypothetical protein
MKINFLPFLVFALAIGGCTKTVEAPDPSENEISNLSTQRKALMFDFTGVNCGACTAILPTFEGFLHANEGKVIGISVHCGSGDTLNTGFSLSFTGQYDIPGTPRFSEGSIMKTDTSYSVAESLAKATMGKPADAGIGLVYSISNNTMTIKTKTRFFNEASGSYKLALYIVEDNIMTEQTGNMRRHDNVLRGSANGYWGTAITPSSVGKGLEWENTFTYNIGTHGIHFWNTANLKVVAIIYKMDGNEPKEVVNCNKW